MLRVSRAASTTVELVDRSRSARSCSSGSPGSSRCRSSCSRASRARPSLIDVDRAWIALLIAGITLAVARASSSFSPAIPRIAGRFAEHENWMRFIGAVHVGVDRLRREPQPGASRCSAPRSSTSCRWWSRSRSSSGRSTCRCRSRRRFAYVPAVVDAAGAAALVQRPRRARRRARCCSSNRGASAARRPSRPVCCGSSPRSS